MSSDVDGHACAGGQAGCRDVDHVRRRVRVVDHADGGSSDDHVRSTEQVDVVICGVERVVHDDVECGRIAGVGDRDAVGDGVARIGRSMRNDLGRRQRPAAGR